MISGLKHVSMKQTSRKRYFFSTIVFLLWLSPQNFLAAQKQDVTITFHLRGVYETNISLLSLNGNGIYKPIMKLESIRNDETPDFRVPEDFLPGEFIVRFDYKKLPGNTPYPSERNILIYDQNLEIWTNPEFCNNTDSTWFQDGEKENSAWLKFIQENNPRKEKLVLLQDFLMNYNYDGSRFYRLGIQEYEKQRKSYNHWLINLIDRDNELFACNLYRFHYAMPVSRVSDRSEHIKNLINHYFDGMDFKNPMILKTSGMNRWMDGYVNLYGQLSSRETDRDSLFSLAGKTAVEKARKGNPKIYGWMVDYFFNGYEKNNIPAGIKILEPYLNDPNCLTTKRMEINRRLKGMESLTKGTRVPDIQLKDANGIPFDLYSFNPSSQYILLLFWSADCNHCIELVDDIYPWQKQPGIQQKLLVVAISLDETETEIAAWNQKIKSLKDWKHIRSGEGIRSKVTSDYYILSTPVMILIDGRTKEIISLPSSLSELKEAMH
jgi:thioredoxin-related protein